MILTGGFWDRVGCLWLLGPLCLQPLVVGNSWLFLFPKPLHFHAPKYVAPLSHGVSSVIISFPSSAISPVFAARCISMSDS